MYTENNEQKLFKEMKNTAMKPNYNLTDFWRPFHLYMIGMVRHSAIFTLFYRGENDGLAHSRKWGRFNQLQCLLLRFNFGHCALLSTRVFHENISFGNSRCPYINNLDSWSMSQ